MDLSRFDDLNDEILSEELTKCGLERIVERFGSHEKWQSSRFEHAVRARELSRLKDSGQAAVTRYESVELAEQVTDSKLRRRIAEDERPMLLQILCDSDVLQDQRRRASVFDVTREPEPLAPARWIVSRRHYFDVRDSMKEAGLVVAYLNRKCALLKTPPMHQFGPHYFRCNRVCVRYGSVRLADLEAEDRVDALEGAQSEGSVDLRDVARRAWDLLVLAQQQDDDSAPYKPLSYGGLSEAQFRLLAALAERYPGSVTKANLESPLAKSRSAIEKSQKVLRDWIPRLADSSSKGYHATDAGLEHVKRHRPPGS